MRSGLVLAFVSAALCASLSAQDWSGSWETHWRGGGASMTLHQDGDLVRGEYPLLEGKVEGRARGRVLEGVWTQAGGRQGGFLFVLARDGESFMGRFASGEWWTGTRVSREQELAAAPGPRTPAEALLAFLRAVNASRGGHLDRVQRALDVVDFTGLPSRRLPGEAMLPGERIERAFALARVLDELTFRIWSLSPEVKDPATPDEVVLPLEQAGTEVVFELRMRRVGKEWRIVAPTGEALEEARERVFARRDGKARDEREHLLLRSPRDTVRTFLEGMGRLDAGGEALVLSTLDLPALGDGVAGEDGLLLARYLGRVLARIGLVAEQEIPDDPGRNRGYLHFKHSAGSIVLTPHGPPGEKRRWLFSAETLRDIGALYAAIEDMPLDESSLVRIPRSPYFALRDRVRARFPALLGRAGAMELWQWVLIGIFLLSSLLLSWLGSALILWSLARYSGQDKAFSSRSARRAVSWPLRWMLFGWLIYTKLEYIGLPVDVAMPFRRPAGTLALIAGTWLVHQSLGVAASFSSRRLGTSGHQAILNSLVFGLLRIAVIVAGALFVADVWGVSSGSILAGLGIGGLAVALSAQPTLQNIIAGFTLFADSPLSVGHFCRFGNRMGTVEQIGLRSTRVRTLERSVVSIPNANFANLQLENLTKRDRMLVRTTLQLRYETSADQLRQVLIRLRELLIEHPRIAEDPARVRFVGFGAHSLDIELFAYVLTSDYEVYLAVREDLYLRVMVVVLETGSSFAFPSQVNYLSRDPGLDGELMRKAEEEVARRREEGALPFPDFDEKEVEERAGKLPWPPEGSVGARPGPDGKGA